MLGCQELKPLTIYKVARLINFAPKASGAAGIALAAVYGFIASSVARIKHNEIEDMESGLFITCKTLFGDVRRKRIYPPFDSIVRLAAATDREFPFCPNGLGGKEKHLDVQLRKSKRAAGIKRADWIELYHFYLSWLLSRLTAPAALSLFLYSNNFSKRNLKRLVVAAASLKPRKMFLISTDDFEKEMSQRFVTLIYRRGLYDHKEITSEIRELSE